MHIMYGNDLRGGGGERERRGKGMGRDWGRREKRRKEMGGVWREGKGKWEGVFMMWGGGCGRYSECSLLKPGFNLHCSGDLVAEIIKLTIILQYTNNIEGMMTLQKEDTVVHQVSKSNVSFGSCTPIAISCTTAIYLANNKIIQRYRRRTKMLADNTLFIRTCVGCTI